MPELDVNGANLYYEDDGSGPESIVFSHGLLFSCRMFDDQVEHFKDRNRCIKYDHRGQGRSEVTASGYDMDTLTEDAAFLIERLDIAPCHFVGLSMGGFVGLRLAIRRPELLKTLTLIETSADPEPDENKGKYKLLNFVARWIGMWAVAGRVMPIMFGKDFLTDPEREAQKKEWRRHLVDKDPVGVSRATRGVIDREGVYEFLGQIKIPTLIIVGDQDTATVPAKSERMHQAIEGSRLVVVKKKKGLGTPPPSKNRQL